GSSLASRDGQAEPFRHPPHALHLVLRRRLGSLRGARHARAGVLHRPTAPLVPVRGDALPCRARRGGHLAAHEGDDLRSGRRLHGEERESHTAECEGRGRALLLMADAGFELPHRDARDHRHPHALAREARIGGPRGLAYVPRRDHVDRLDPHVTRGAGDHQLAHVDLPLWADILLVFIAVWIVLCVWLVIVGRVLLARELSLLVPNLIRLFGGLLRDARVPLRAKIVLAVASLWLASPIDLILDFSAIIGSLDDAVVAALALRFVLRTTDRAVVREPWHGDPAPLERLV